MTNFNELSDITTLATGDKLAVNDASDSNTTKSTTPGQILTYVQANAALAGNRITSGTIADARIASTITRDSDLATVATSGSYADLVGKPVARDICVVGVDTNTELTNTTVRTEFNSFNTTALVNSNAAVFTGVATNGVTCVAGTYRVTVQVYYTATTSRWNTGIRVAVDGTSEGATGAMGFLRNADGHDEASVTVEHIVVLGSTARVGWTHIQLSGYASTVTMPAGETTMIIDRIS
ncbi:MAG: hypothetical protein ACPG7F_01740 [Aggregatilineales bacterium]